MFLNIFQLILIIFILIYFLLFSFNFNFLFTIFLVILIGSIILEFKRWATTLTGLTAILFLSNFLIFGLSLLLWLPTSICLRLPKCFLTNYFCHQQDNPSIISIFSLLITSIILLQNLIKRWILLLRQKIILENLIKHPLLCATFFNHFCVRMEMMNCEDDEEDKELFYSWLNSFGKQLRSKISVGVVSTKISDQKKNQQNKKVQFNKAVSLNNSTQKIGYRLTKRSKSAKYISDYCTIESAGELAAGESPKKILSTKPKVPRTPIPQTTPTDPLGPPLKHQPTLLSPITPEENKWIFNRHSLKNEEKIVEENLEENKILKEKVEEENKLIIETAKCLYCPTGVNCCVQNVQARSIHYYTLSTDISPID
uniref:Uncharacterized protein n=1 Tax=Meloidogyne enterolobii TaxID=390850 RepID=A0A6V7WDZ5_MELEN|nr:unnamed protein product [Meloidogyne enterolobii]